MHFESKKAEDCFSDAENYQYRLEICGDEFLKLLSKITNNIRINDQLRRPTFTAELDGGLRIKGLLDKPVIKVGFNLELANPQRRSFELWLTRQ
jgi:hypothetical protein